MLQEALEAEVKDFIQSYKGHRDHDSRWLAVRNGYHKEMPPNEHKQRSSARCLEVFVRLLVLVEKLKDFCGTSFGHHPQLSSFHASVVIVLHRI